MQSRDAGGVHPVVEESLHGVGADARRKRFLNQIEKVRGADGTGFVLPAQFRQDFEKAFSAEPLPQHMQNPSALLIGDDAVRLGSFRSFQAVTPGEGSSRFHRGAVWAGFEEVGLEVRHNVLQSFGPFLLLQP